MSQIKSKDRVRDLAEVYTNEREVKAMLDLISLKKEDDVISYKYLEPACGNGNFLAEILARKLNRVNEKYSESSLNMYEFYLARAVSTIFGIDICPENVEEGRGRLLRQVKNNFDLHKGSFVPSAGFFDLLQYMLHQNIVVGDSINRPDDIYFMEFKVKGKKFGRQVFRFSDLIDSDKPEPVDAYPFEHFLKIGQGLSKKQLELEL